MLVRMIPRLSCVALILSVIAGAAASLQTFMRLVIGSALGAFIGQLYDGSARPLAFSLVAAGAVALLLVLFSERGRLFQRRHGVVPQA